MTVTTYKVGPMDNNCYLVGDGNDNYALIDASYPDENFINAITKLGNKLKAILLTHGHFDHIMSVGALRKATGAKVAIHKRDAIGLSSPAFSLAASNNLEQQPEKPDVLLDDGDEITVGDLTFKTIYTPGHTIGSVCYVCGDHLFTGDTVFRLGVGRTDFPTGSQDKLLESLLKINALKGDYKVCPGHEKASTLDVERTCNPFFLRVLRK